MEFFKKLYIFAHVSDFKIIIRIKRTECHGVGYLQADLCTTCNVHISVG